MTDERGQSADRATKPTDRGKDFQGHGAAVTSGSLADCAGDDGGGDSGGTVRIGACIPPTGALALGKQSEWL